MFAVIYAFSVHPGKEEIFEQSWYAMTELIRDYEGGLGSRLHRKEDGMYIAYAQWPDRSTWDKAGDHLPETANAIRVAMRESCLKIETLHELNLVADLLVPVDKING